MGLLALQSKVFLTLQAGIKLVLSSVHERSGAPGLFHTPKRTTPSTLQVLLRIQTAMCSLKRCDSLYFFHLPVLTQTQPFHVSQGIFQSKLISTILGSIINGIVPLHIDIKKDRPIGTFVLAIQSVCFCVSFLCSHFMIKLL
jgi:hypothetical protein